MKSSGQCPKCESTNILCDVKAIDLGDYNAQYDLMVGVAANPTARLFRQQHCSTLSAWVCGDCGYVEFYADDPQGLVNAASMAERRRRR
jgi:predicted nucleic-acid-binding Zn-ribbon protein